MAGSVLEQCTLVELHVFQRRRGLLKNVVEMCRYKLSKTVCPARSRAMPAAYTPHGSALAGRLGGPLSFECRWLRREESRTCEFMGTPVHGGGKRRKLCARAQHGCVFGTPAILLSELFTQLPPPAMFYLLAAPHVETSSQRDQRQPATARPEQC